MKRLFFVLSVLTLACFASVSCQKEDSQAPVPPSIETLTLDFNKIPIKPATKASVDPGFNVTPITDIIYGVWQYIYTSIINVPMRSFEAILDVEPVSDGNGQWTWESKYTEWGMTYTVALIGKESRGKINWELQVSRDGLGGFRNYSWITGWSYKDGSAGEWKISVGPHDTSVLITSSWKAQDGKVQSIKLSYGLDHKCGNIGEFFNGSYIEYSLGATDPAYDSSLFMHYNQNVVNLNIDVSIEWNSKNGNCRVYSNKVYSDHNWHAIS